MKQKPLKVIAGLPDKPLTIGDIEMAAYVLEDETRVLSQRSMIAGIGLKSGGGSSGSASKVPRFFTSKILKPFIPQKLQLLLEEPILFSTPTKGNIAFGYPATILPDICEVVLLARDANKLTKSQLHIAQQCETLMRALARVGIIALVDEVTGYQSSRSKDALRVLVGKYLLDYAREWIKEFYDPFFEELDKIYNNPKTESRNRPKYYGTFINTYIYKPIENGEIFKKLKKLNPTDNKGRRKNKLHQFFSEDFGLRILRDRISKITAILEISQNKEDFIRNYKKFKSRQKWFEFPEDEPKDDNDKK